MKTHNWKSLKLHPQNTKFRPSSKSRKSINIDFFYIDWQYTTIEFLYSTLFSFKSAISLKNTLDIFENSWVWRMSRMSIYKISQYRHIYKNAANNFQWKSIMFYKHSSTYLKNKNDMSVQFWKNIMCHFDNFLPILGPLQNPINS